MKCNCQLFSIGLFISKLCIFSNSINAVGVEIGMFNGMANEKNVLLLPGLPLVNRPGKNPEPDLWIFEVGTPDASVAAVDSPSAKARASKLFVSMLNPSMCSLDIKYYQARSGP